MRRASGLAKLARLCLLLAAGVGAGLAIGFLVSLTDDDGDCSTDVGAAYAAPLAAGPSADAAAAAAEDSSYRDEQYEPRLVSSATRRRPSRAASPAAAGGIAEAPSRAPVRTRYASVELDIKETALVGVLTSRQTLRTRAVALNRSLAHVVPKLLFFALGGGGRGGASSPPPPPPPPPDLPVVSFPSSTVKSLPLRAIKYMADKYGGQYAFFVLVPDVSYVRGRKLLELLRSCNVDGDTYYAGSPYRANERYCDLKTGIVLSRAIAVRIASSQLFSTCITKEGSLSSLTEVVGHCVQLAANVTCSPKIGDRPFAVMAIGNYANTADLTQESDFNSSLVYYPVHTDTEIYQLHRSICGVELAETRAALRAVKDEIIANSQMSNGSVVLSWPIGLALKSKIASRFEVIQWTYFTDDGFYFVSDSTNFKPMDESEKGDINRMVGLAMQELSSQAKSSRYALVKLVNGYRRFEPARGMEYILDLVVADCSTSRNVSKRVELIKPLTQAEIYRMPPVRSAATVHVVLPLQLSDEACRELPRFLSYYEKACSPHKDRSCRLFAVIVPEDRELPREGAASSAAEKRLQRMREILQDGSFRFNGTVEIVWLSANEVGSPAQPLLASVRAAIAKLPPEALVLCVTVTTRLDGEYLTIVRQYAVRGSQVYAPVGFWEYKPELIYDRDLPAPESPSIVKEQGHFDPDSDDHLAFYAGDFQRTERAADERRLAYDSPLEAFWVARELFVFRPIEPLLKVWHTKIICSAASMSARRFGTCSRRRAFNLADKSKLASLVLERSPSYGDI